MNLASTDAKRHFVGTTNRTVAYTTGSSILIDVEFNRPFTATGSVLRLELADGRVVSAPLDATSDGEHILKYEYVITASDDASVVIPHTIVGKLYLTPNTSLVIGTSNLKEITPATPEITSFNTVAELLADTVFDHDTVSAGAIIRAERYWYSAAASGATDNHVVTAGGLKLYVLATPCAHVKAFGATGSTGTDDLTALRAAIASKLPLDFGINETYETTDDIGNGVNMATGLYWKGDGCKVLMTGSSHIQALCSVVMTAVTDVQIDGIFFDGASKVNRGIQIKTSTVSGADGPRVVISNTRVERCRRADATFAGGDGILVQGAFESVRVGPNVIVKNIALAAGAGSSGSVGVTGVTVTHDNSAADYPRDVVVDGLNVENVYSEDVAYADDMDGLRVFGPWTNTDSAFVANSFSVKNSYFKNCWGRAIKSQTFSTSVVNISIERSAGPNTQRNYADIDSQIAGGSFRDIRGWYTNAHGPRSVIRVSGIDNAAGTDNMVDPVTIDRVRLNLDATSTCESICQASTSNGLTGCLTMTGCVSDGVGDLTNMLRIFSHTSSDTNFFTVRNCAASVIAADTVSSGGNKSFVHARGLNPVGTPSVNVSVEDCSYTGAAVDVHIAEGEDTGNPSDILFQGQNNTGFVDTTANIRADEGLQYWSAPRLPRFFPGGGAGFFETKSFTVNAGATSDIPFNLDTGALVFLQVGYNKNASAIFSIDDTNGTDALASGSEIGIGNITEPGAGRFRLWSNGTGLRVKNTDGSNRRFVMFVMCPI